MNDFNDLFVIGSRDILLLSVENDASIDAIDFCLLSLFKILEPACFQCSMLFDAKRNQPKGNLSLKGILVIKEFNNILSLNWLNFDIVCFRNINAFLDNSLNTETGIFSLMRPCGRTCGQKGS